MMRRLGFSLYCLTSCAGKSSRGSIVLPCLHLRGREFCVAHKQNPVQVKTWEEPHPWLDFKVQAAGLHGAPSHCRWRCDDVDEDSRPILRCVPRWKTGKKRSKQSCSLGVVLMEYPRAPSSSRRPCRSPWRRRQRRLGCGCWGV